MGRTERTLLVIGGIVPLPFCTLSAIEYSIITGQPFLEVLATALLVGFTFGLLVAAALGQVLKRLPMQQIDGMLIIAPKTALRARRTTEQGPTNDGEDLL